MEPIITELNIQKTLLNPITYNENVISEININRLILKPIIKKIIFETIEFGRIKVYEGEELFEYHKNDSQEILINKLLEIIDSNY